MNNPVSSTAAKRDQVVSIINSVISKVKSPGDVSRETLYKELHTLKDIIDDLRSQLGSMNAGAISQTHIPSATDELDAVVQMTEKASGSIMDSCEKIQARMAGEKKELVDDVNAQVTAIFEACTFQDITGQRISKVIKTLKDIDSRVAGLMSALEGQFTPAEKSVLKDTRSYEESLLNGPQLPQSAISQDDIDKLLAALDNQG